MPTYDEQIEKDQNNSELLMIIGLALIYDEIRSQSKYVASKWREAAPEENAQAWLNERKRNQKLIDDVNSIRPEYRKADKYTEARYQDEYSSKYYRQTYPTVQQFRGENYSIRIRKYKSNQFRSALNSSLSKFQDPKLLRDDRGKSLNRIYNTIRTGLLKGDSLQKINRAIDIELGYRDKATGKLIAKPVNYKGDFSKRMRVLRTEINRIRAQAANDEWNNEQEMGIESELVYVATLDNRTRPQSAVMDGQVANDEGRFRYPDGNYYIQSNTGNPAWDINDRCDTVKMLPKESIDDYARSARIGKSVEVAPYRNYREYAKDIGLKRNKYGQTYYKER